MNNSEAQKIREESIQKQVKAYKEYQESLLNKGWTYPGLCEFKIFTYEEQKFNADRGFFTTAYLKYKGYHFADFVPEIEENFKTREYDVVGINIRPSSTFKEIINLVRDVNYTNEEIIDKISYNLNKSYSSLQAAINATDLLKKYVYNEMKNLL